MEKNSYTLIDTNPQIAKVYLGEDVVGGNDALEFITMLEEIIKLNVRHIVINLSNVKIMNSSGLGMLVNSLSNLRQNNISLMLVSPSDKIRVLLKMTHLDQVFSIYSDYDSAIQNCK